MRVGVGILAGMAVAVWTSTVHATVLIDFGHENTQTVSETLTGSQRLWNNVWNNNASSSNQPYGATPAMTLLNTAGSDSNIRLKISNTATSGNNLNKGFESQNENGITTPAGSAADRGYPGTATRDSLFGYSLSSGSFTNPTLNVILTLTGLEAGQPYNFFGFAARTGVSDNREQQILFQGAGGPVPVIYQAGNNTAGNTFASGNVIADPTGQITLTISPTANNNNVNRFTYLGVLEIVPVPEPTGLGLIAAAGTLLLSRRRR